MDEQTLTKEEAGYLAGVLDAYLATNYASINPLQLVAAKALWRKLSAMSR